MNACVLFGIQIVVFNTCLVCGLGDMYEHGCYCLDLIPYWIVNEEGACKLCLGDSLMRLFIMRFPGGVEVRGAVMTLCGQGRTIDMGTLSKSV